MKDKPGIGHNDPPILVELTPELATFVIRNCQSNLLLGLNLVIAVGSAEAAAPILELREQFHAVMKAVRDAGGKDPDAE